jgi:adenylyl-sulfate kinase
MEPNAIEAAQASADNCSTVILFTGLSGSGKTTLGQAVLRRLRESGSPVLLLDGDTFRRDHAPDLGFSREDRAENLRRAGLIARAAADAGSIVLLSFIAPYAADRARLHKQMVSHYFFEVWLSAPVEVCEQRDVKGLYKRARSKDLASFTGVTDTYEPPVHPDHVLPTHLWSLDQCCGSLLDFLENVRLSESGGKEV